MNKQTQKTLFSSKTDDWATPQAFFDKMNAKYGPFDLDVCATPGNTKCKVWFGWVPAISSHNFVDGLQESWSEYLFYGRVAKCWMNPPYGRGIGEWVKKAYEESQKGCLVVCLLPARTCTTWFHNWIYGKPNAELHFLRGRLKFGGATNSAPFPSMIVVFRPKTT